jgi:CRP-like cAMP-binding protein
MASAPRQAWGDLATTAFVESSHLFKSLDPDARRDILQIATLLDVAPNEIVPAAATSGDSFYLVLDGSASVLVPGRDGPVEIARLERGAFFGEARVLGGGRPASLCAVTELTLVAFPVLVIGAVAERFPKVKKLLETVRAARERDASERLAS